VREWTKNAESVIVAAIKKAIPGRAGRLRPPRRGNKASSAREEDEERAGSERTICAVVHSLE